MYHFAYLFSSLLPDTGTLVLAGHIKDEVIWHRMPISTTGGHGGWDGRCKDLCYMPLQHVPTVRALRPCNKVFSGRFMIYSPYALYAVSGET